MDRYRVKILATGVIFGALLVGGVFALVGWFSYRSLQGVLAGLFLGCVVGGWLGYGWGEKVWEKEQVRLVREKK